MGHASISCQTLDAGSRTSFEGGTGETSEGRSVGSCLATADFPLAAVPAKMWVARPPITPQAFNMSLDGQGFRGQESPG